MTHMDDCSVMHERQHHTQEDGWLQTKTNCSGCATERGGAAGILWWRALDAQSQHIGSLFTHGSPRSPALPPPPPPAALPFSTTAALPWLPLGTGANSGSGGSSSLIGLQMFMLFSCTLHR